MHNDSCVFIKNKNITRYLAIFLFIVSFFFISSPANAQLDVGSETLSENIALSSSSPLQTASRLINSVMIILGILAVGIVLFAGFMWMTSGGSAEKIDQAKNILKNGVIGLIIILSAWGITIFILNLLAISTGNGSTPGPICSPGAEQVCGCDGLRTCTADGVWGPCIGGECSGPIPVYCSNDPFPSCDPNDTMCDDDQYCENDCFCVPKGALGDSCNANPDPVCTADNTRCGEYLNCNETTCLCEGSPVIMGVSPVGGFCDNDVNMSCKVDADCSLSTCNLDTPNGEKDNLITINGFNFGNYDAGLSKVIFINVADELDFQIAFNAKQLNADCDDTWTDQQIIVGVPNDIAETSIIVVETADGQKDDTSSSTPGPILPDFQKNNIVRPGICTINPDSGLLRDQVTYQGVNLFQSTSTKAYFGDYLTNVKGLEPVFTDPLNLSGADKVPNIQSGKLSSFVVANINGNEEKSNYVNFYKNPEPNAGPFLSYFDPVRGSSGQYVTIHGSGFGNVQGSSEVFFVNNADVIEADYDFPPVCANSTWTDRQVIVKVPEGLVDGDYYYIYMKINGKEINSENANPNHFEADSSAPLLTSICRVSPSRGQVGVLVNIWGEYFGGVATNATAIFTPGSASSSVSTTVLLDQGAEKIVAEAPLAASTGPLKVSRGVGTEGNSVNFELGACNNDSECGSDKCCPRGSFKQNQCVGTLADCYDEVPTSVFEWNFSTIFGGVNTSTPSTYDSCQGMANFLGACQDNVFCPNSVGRCSTCAATTTELEDACGTDACNILPACNGGCQYESSGDCRLIGSVCSLDSTLVYELGDSDFTAQQSCKAYPQYGGQAHWEIRVPTSCPEGWTRLSFNRCVDDTSTTTSTCSLCGDSLTCLSDNNSATGTCFTEKLCPSGSSCDTSVNRCITTQNATCDCCCKVGEDARDCCAPLICGGSCGDGAANKGLCSNCAITSPPGPPGPPYDQDLSDAACNCEISSGKYCDTTVIVGQFHGVCNDCSKLSTSSCMVHSSCCIDSRGTADTEDDVCVGGTDRITNGPNIGYCSYYNCDINTNPNVCASSTKLAIGLFRDISQCEADCQSGNAPDLCEDLNLDACKGSLSCCYDFSNDKCKSGDQLNSGNSALPLHYGYCAYYNCIEDGASCDDTHASTTGTYDNLNACISGCTDNTGPGLSCVGEDDYVCNFQRCGSPYACLQESGDPGLISDCGTCCCKTDETPDSCSGIGDGNLTCWKDQGACDGDNRGLCCGCEEDSDCGDHKKTGCSSNTCCEDRPKVVENEVLPKHGADNVCRNVGIVIPFDKNMDRASLPDNILLFEERDYDEGPCPSGTFLTQITPQRNFVQRINLALRQSINFIKSIFIGNHLSPSVLAYTPPDEEKLYCSVPGFVSNRQNATGTVAIFRPKRLLAPSRTHYLVVKGDISLDSKNGVLSSSKIGMNGAGFRTDVSTTTEGEDIKFNNLSFAQSHITSFITFSDQGANSGVCAVDHVKVDPPSYLFQTTDNDVNEVDNDAKNNSFDTARDRDKVFSADAYSIDNQLLATTTYYDWKWNFDIVHTAIATKTSVAELDDNRVFVQAISGVTDGRTTMKTKIEMVESNVYNDGDGIIVNTPLFVFLCKNPWPPVGVSGTWSPWYDTCVNKKGGNDCSPYNHALYYCRDAGNDGIGDDLPAMINPGIVFGTASSTVCSEGRTPCDPAESRCGPDNNGDGTPDGFCVSSILKESYFFKEAKPTVGSISSAENKEDGSRVEVKWSGNSSLIYNSTPSLMGKYRLYYAKENSGSWSYIDVKPNSLVEDTVPVCAPTSPTSTEDYNCEITVGGLDNNTKYRFKVSAISFNKVESKLSGEKTVLVTDKTPPNTPQGFIINAIDDNIIFSWSANTDDTLFYRLYHGVQENKFGESFQSANHATSMVFHYSEFPLGLNWFGLSAVDSSANEKFASPISISTYIVDPSSTTMPN